MGHEGFQLLSAHPLADRPLHAGQSDPELILQQLTGGPDAAVAQVVDIVHLPFAALRFEDVTDDLDDVLPAEDALLQGDLHAQLLVHLQPADLGEVVPTRIEKDILQQGLGALQGGGVARAHPPVDFDQRLIRAAGVVLQQGLADLEHLAVIRPRQDLEGLHAPLLELLHQFAGDLLPALAQDLARPGLDHVPGQEAAHHVAPGDRNLLELQGLTPLQPTSRDTLTRRQHGLLPVGHLPSGVVPRHARRAQIEEQVPLGQRERVAAVEEGQDRLIAVVPQRPEQDRGQKLSPAIHSHVEHVVGVEFEFQPGPAIGDQPGRKECFAAAMRGPAVVVEEHAGRPVQLAHHDPFRAVDDEGAVLGHQGHLAQVDLLLLDVPDAPSLAPRLLVPDHQAQGHLQGDRVGHPLLPAFLGGVLGIAELVPHELQ